jgi:hypothetical protein
MKRYQVIVSNVGTVLDTDNGFDAHREYSQCVGLSKSGKGRMGGEDVTLMAAGEPIKEHTGSQHDED